MGPLYGVYHSELSFSWCVCVLWSVELCWC